MSKIKNIKENNILNQLLADYAAVSGTLATYIGDREPSEEEKHIMDRLLEIHADLVAYAFRQTG